MILSKDFEDFVRLLNKYKVDYMIVGGYALAFHGKPRHTGDLDIWIDISESNAAKMLKVLHQFGMSALGLKKEDFLKPGYMTQIGYPPLRIDILNNIDGVDFAEALINRQTVNLDNGLYLYFIGIKDLIQNKKSTGRDQDLVDVKTLTQKNTPKKRPDK